MIAYVKLNWMTINVCDSFKIGSRIQIIILANFTCRYHICYLLFSDYWNQFVYLFTLHYLYGRALMVSVLYYGRTDHISFIFIYFCGCTTQKPTGSSQHLFIIRMTDEDLSVYSSKRPKVIVVPCCLMCVVCWCLRRGCPGHQGLRQKTRWSSRRCRSLYHLHQSDTRRIRHTMWHKVTLTGSLKVTI